MYKNSLGMLKDKMKHPKIIIPFIVMFQLILNTSVGAAWILPDNSQTVPYGITVDGHNIGGLNRQQAVKYLRQNSSGNFVEKIIVLKNGTREWFLPTKEYDFRYDYAKTIDTVLEETPWESNCTKVLGLMKLQAKNMDIPLEISWHEEGLNGYLESINEEMMVPARNASLQVSDGSILIINEQSGEEIDFEGTLAKILESIKLDNAETVNIVKKTLLPDIVSEDLAAVDCALAAFDTELNNNNKNRTDNIILASQLLDGTIIMPGDSFSFNQVVGERSTENGFKDAPVIIGGSVQQDVGGGICQVATTLYNASLLTGLEIIERSPHSIPVKYAPHGQDATVFYGQIDLKIKNNLSNPIIINSAADNNSLIITIYGNHQDKNNI